VAVRVRVKLGRINRVRIENMEYEW